ncbi:hypothetical protein ACWTU6_15430 [Mesorhizobium sp. BHbsci]
MQPSPSEHDPYNGLTRLEPSLPSSAYWDIEAYQRDLDAIWYRSWLLVCREADLAQPLAFRTFCVGTEEIVAAGVDLWPRPDGSGRRPRTDPSRRQ